MLHRLQTKRPDRGWLPTIRWCTSVCFSIILVVASISLGYGVSSTLASSCVWSTQTVDSAGNAGFWGMSLAFDSSGSPGIAYCAGDKEGLTTNQHWSLKYAHWNSSGWDIQTVDNTSEVGYFNSLVFDSAGYPCIAYYDGTNQDLKYAHWNGAAWVIELVDSQGQVGLGVSLVMDGADHPAISYAAMTDAYGYGSDCLKYAHWNGTGWTLETVDSGGRVGDHTSLAFDSSGNPAIGYGDTDNQTLKYAVWNGLSWDTSVVRSEDSGYVFGISLAFDASGKPAISSVGFPNNDLKFNHWNGSGWDSETVDSSGRTYPSLRFDPMGEPAISYKVTTNHGDWIENDLGYACKSGSVWTIKRIDNTSDVGWLNSLAFAPNGYPAISWYDGTNGDLEYASGRASLLPNQPSNISPIDGATGESRTLSLSSSEFSDPDPDDTHAASQWQITAASSNYSAPVFDNTTNASNLTGISVPSGVLDLDTVYYWRVRYEDSYGVWSDFSQETSFRTAASKAEDPPPDEIPSTTDVSGLALSVEDFPLGWSQQGESTEGDGYFKRLFLNIENGVYDPDIVICEVKAFPNVPVAKEGFSDARSEMSKKYSMSELDIGEESYVYSDMACYVCCLRIGNVIGRITTCPEYGGSLENTEHWAKVLESKIQTQLGLTDGGDGSGNGTPDQTSPSGLATGIAAAVVLVGAGAVGGVVTYVVLRKRRTT